MIRLWSSVKIPMRQEEYQIIFKQQFSAQDVTIVEVLSNRSVDLSLEQLCKGKWAEMLSDAQKQGKGLWDSEIYRFESGTVHDDSISLRVSTIPFSIRFAMNSYPDLVQKLGIRYASLGMYTSCFVKTSDETFLFIEKSNKYFTNKKISFIGGVLSKTETELLSGRDLFDGMLKEVIEETGIDSVDIKANTLRCGYITENYNMCLLFEVSLNKSFGEVWNGFEDKNDGEAIKLIGVKQIDFGSFIETIERKDAVKFEILDLV